MKNGYLSLVYIYNVNFKKRGVMRRGLNMVMEFLFFFKIIYFEIVVLFSGYFRYERNEDVLRWFLDSVINILCYFDMYYLSLEYFLLVDRF